MTRTCPKVRAARAERLFSLTRPIIFLICEVVVAVPVVGAKLHVVSRERSNKYVKKKVEN